MLAARGGLDHYRARRGPGFVLTTTMSAPLRQPAAPRCRLHGRCCGLQPTLCAKAAERLARPTKFSNLQREQRTLMARSRPRPSGTRRTTFSLQIAAGNSARHSRASSAMRSNPMQRRGNGSATLKMADLLACNGCNGLRRRSPRIRDRRHAGLRDIKAETRLTCTLTSGNRMLNRLPTTPCAAARQLHIREQDGRPVLSAGGVARA